MDTTISSAFESLTNELDQLISTLDRIQEMIDIDDLLQLIHDPTDKQVSNQTSILELVVYAPFILGKIGGLSEVTKKCAMNIQYQLYELKQLEMHGKDVTEQ